MLQRSASIIAAMMFLSLTVGMAQVSNDWRARYGPPEAETYIVRDGIVLTVFYSGQGKACKAVIDPLTPQPHDTFDDLLQEIIPLGDRGKELNSIGLSTGPYGGIHADLYERVSISIVTVAQGPTLTLAVESATVRWKGVQCKLPEQQEEKHK